MKSGRVMYSGLIILVFYMVPLKGYGQATELAQLALNIEKLAQFKQILSDLKKGYEIVFKGYSTVKDIAEGNFSIHKNFLDGLMAVSPTVKKYQKIALIIDYQIRLVKESRQALQRFQRQGTFSPHEIGYLSNVYGNLVDQSLQNLDELITVTTAGKLRMSDDERLAAIDRIYADMADKLLFLANFNEGAAMFSLSKAKEQHELQTLKNIQGITTNKD